jgi:hypothetical protein
MLILSAVKTDDDEETINKKIQLVSEFVDDFASFRIFNYKRINWNTNKLILFHVMCKIRDKDIHTIGFHLTQTLEQMSEKIDGVVEFSLNQFTTRYMLHMLSRFTSYINIKVGYQSDFEKYIDRNSNTPYDIEHILPDDYESYREFFNDEEDFKNYRQKVGNLIILTRDKNRSYQDMNYSQKVEQYANDNILAQALNPLIYNNSPHFKQLVPLYGFKHIEQFDKEAIKSRADTYLRIAKDIWNIDHLKEIAGGWDIDPETLGSEKRYTFGYAERSWPDALKYGFLSANIDSTGKSIKNLSIGDKLFCYIRNKGFVGIGICTSIAVPMEQFMVTCDDGLVKPIADVGWIEEARKKELEQKQEWFVGVKWQQYVKSEDEGFRESDLTVIPMTVYTTKDNDTYDKVIEFFNKREK